MDTHIYDLHTLKNVVKTFCLEKFGSRYLTYLLFGNMSEISQFLFKGTLKCSVVFIHMKEGAILNLKIKSKFPAEPHFSLKQAEKVEKLVLLWQK